MGRFSVTYVPLVPRVARKHRLVQAPRPGVTVVFLTFRVLAQGGGGVARISMDLIAEGC